MDRVPLLGDAGAAGVTSRAGLTTGPGLADAQAMLWYRWITLDCRIRVVLAERMERGATDELDLQLAALIAERERVEPAG